MNILLIIKRFDFGGSENHVQELANHLVQMGHQVILIGGDGEQKKHLLPAVRFYKTRMTDALMIVNLIKIIFLVKRHKIDIIHSHQRLAIMIGAIAGLITRCKVVATVHGRTRYDMRSRLSRSLTDRIIFVSKSVYELSPRHYLINDKSVVIPNGIKLKSYNQSPKPFRLCYICRIDKSHFSFLKLMIEEVLDSLIEAYPLLELQIVGEGIMKEKLCNLTEKFNAKYNSNRCNVIGYAFSVDSYIQQASVVLGVGRVAIETLAAGVPLISVNSRRMSGLVTRENYERLKVSNFIDITAPIPNSNNLSITINSFFSNQNHFQNEALSLAKQVQEDFSLEKITNKTISVYNELQIKM